MSNTHAPRSASAPAGPSRRRTARGRVRDATPVKPEPPAPATWGQRFRRYLPAAAAPLAVLALAVVAVCFGTILIAGWRLAYLPAAIGQVWLTINAVPVRFDGVTLGIIPLLPAIGVVALVASRIRAATRARVSVLDLAAILAITVLTSVTLSAIALFMVSDASQVFAIGAPNPASAIVRPLGLHLLGFVLGIRHVVWQALAKRAGVPVEVVNGAHAAWRVVRDLLWAALAVYVVCLVASQSRVSEIGAQFANLDWLGGLVLALLTIAYLPNAAVATLAVLLGGSATFGSGTLSLFTATAVALPPLPALAAAPATVPAWAPALMLVPAAVLVRFVVSRSFTLVDATLTAAWAAVLGVLAAWYASGAAGAYGDAGTNPWVLAGLLFAWVAVCAFAAWLVSLVRSRSRGIDS